MGSLREFVHKTLQKRVESAKNTGKDKETIASEIQNSGDFSQMEPYLYDTIKMTFHALDGAKHSTLALTHDAHSQWTQAELIQFTGSTNFDALSGKSETGSESVFGNYPSSFVYQYKTARLNNGDYAIVRVDSDGNGGGIYCTIYGSDHSVKVSEFLVNTYTINHQLFPAISALDTGGFVIVWESIDQDGDGNGIYGKVYGASPGYSPIIVEFQVNTYTIKDQSRPQVVGLLGGGFAVVWESVDQDGDNKGIYSRVYGSAPDYPPITGEFQVNTDTTGVQQLPQVASLLGGGFIVVWDSKLQDGDNSGVFLQKFGAGPNYSPEGVETQVNTYTFSAQISFSVVRLINDNMLILWQSFGQDGSGYGVYAQLYDGNLDTIGGEVTVSVYTSGDQRDAKAVSLPSGEVVILWNSFGQDGDDFGIYGKIYYPDLTIIADEFQINTNTVGIQRLPAAVGLGFSNFFVTFENVDDAGLYYQEYSII